MSIFPRQIQWDKHCFVYCGPENCNCGASATQLEREQHECMAFEGHGEIESVCEPANLAGEGDSLVERMATVEPSVVEQSELLNALISMTGWTKAYAADKGWTPENASLIWACIRNAENVLDKAMGGPKPPGYFAPSNVLAQGREPLCGEASLWSGRLGG